MQKSIGSHRCKPGFPPALFACLAAGICLLLLSLGARAATESWNPGDAGGGNGTWDTGTTANWNAGQTWTSGGDALFSGTGGTVTVTSPSANSLAFSASGPYLLESGTLTLTGSNVTVNSAATISTEVLSTATDLHLSGPSSLTLTGTTISYEPNFNLESDLSALAVTNAGYLFDEEGYIAYDPGSSSVVSVSGTGSTWFNSDELYVANSGTGTLQVTGGGYVTSYHFNVYVGYNAGSDGVVTVFGSGSRLNANSDLGIGESGTGILQITSGGAVTDGFSELGANADSSGTVSVSGSGSTWTSASFYLGNSGTGAVLITNGGAVSTPYGGDIGYNAGSNGLLSVSGTGSTWTTGALLEVGLYGTGGVHIINGGSCPVVASITSAPIPVPVVP